MSLLEVTDFHKSFGTKQVHNGVSFSIEKGECFGLIGGSGSGKSTLLRCLIGLERPDAGTIMYEGKDISKLPENDLFAIRRRIAYVFQGGALFDSMTVYENLAYPLRAHTELSEQQIGETIRNLLNDFGLKDSEALYPASLSGGMQKRVGLARATILEPDVILYDEPTAGLDPFNTKRIQEKILQMKAKGKTSILVTHDMPAAFAVCDRIGMIMKGKLAAIETVDNIQKNHQSIISQFVHGEVP